MPWVQCLHHCEWRRVDGDLSDRHTVAAHDDRVVAQRALHRRGCTFEHPGLAHGEARALAAAVREPWVETEQRHVRIAIVIAPVDTHLEAPV